MIPYGWHVGWWVAVALPLRIWAQTPVGNGLQGAYYQGTNFEQYVSSRRDATLNFDWHMHKPVAGVGAEQFSVRWTGWLVPPTTGRYVLHLSVDDGLRLWLNERLLLDDWRSKGLHYYQIALDLHAGQAYPVRLDYCQAVQAAHLRLAWEPPAISVTRGHERSRRGVLAAGAATIVIPTRYLFTYAPTLPPVPLLADTPTAAPPPQLARQTAATASVVVVHPRDVEAIAKPRPRSYLPVVARPSLAPRVSGSADSDRVAALAARLAAGKLVTLRTLYFEQGQAVLLPAVQASLDTVAQVLVSHPTLRFEVQGHTDNQGDPGINQRLSQQRAAAVCAYLTEHGVATNRLRAVGYGGSRPVADNSQPSQRPFNRRVVLKPLRRE